jgi:hypothetical protein
VRGIGYATALAVLSVLAMLFPSVDTNHARCKDGTTTTATGRGACSHHGGVAK